MYAHSVASTATLRGGVTLASVTTRRSSTITYTNYKKLQELSDLGHTAEEIWDDLVENCRMYVFITRPSAGAAPETLTEGLAMPNDHQCTSTHTSDHGKLKANVPRAMVRASVYAKYGPAVLDPTTGLLALRGGQRLMMPHEERLIIQEELRAMVVEMFTHDIKDGRLRGRVGQCRARTTGSATSLPPIRSRVTPPVAATKLIAPNVSSMSIPDKTYGVEMNDQKSEFAAQSLEMTPVELNEVIMACRKDLVREGFLLPLVDDGSEHTYPHKYRSPPQQRTVSADGAPSHKKDIRSNYIPQLTVTPLKCKHNMIRSTLADRLSDAILCERERRINNMKRSDAKLSDIRSDTSITNRQATLIYNRTYPTVYGAISYETPQHVQRALHRHSCIVVNIEDGNNPEVVSNIKCLRPDYVARPEDVPQGWDGYCCIRNKSEGKNPLLRKRRAFFE
eukprot:Tbor_TRINITY_DN7435_c0_g1::TRINITY_DN7435_c0_g1_i1::g.14590::m.14590